MLTNYYLPVKTEESRRLRERGASMIEVIIALGIFAVFMASALPDFSEMRDSFERGLARHQFDAALQRARAAAVGEGAHALVQTGAGGLSYRVGLDIFPFQTPNAIESPLTQVVLPPGITLILSGPIVFDGRGASVDGNGTMIARTVEMVDDGETVFSGTIFPSGFMVYD